jgi:hypothetical protein
MDFTAQRTKPLELLATLFGFKLTPQKRQIEQKEANGLAPSSDRLAQESSALERPDDSAIWNKAEALFESWIRQEGQPMRQQLAAKLAALEKFIKQNQLHRGSGNSGDPVFHVYGLTRNLSELLNPDAQLALVRQSLINNLRNADSVPSRRVELFLMIEDALETELELVDKRFDAIARQRAPKGHYGTPPQMLEAGVENPLKQILDPLVKPRRTMEDSRVDCAYIFTMLDSLRQRK